MLTKSIKRQGKGQRITINGFCPARQTPTTSNSTLSIANNQTAKQLKHQFIASQKKTSVTFFAHFPQNIVFTCCLDNRFGCETPNEHRLLPIQLGLDVGAPITMGCVDRWPNTNHKHTCVVYERRRKIIIKFKSSQHQVYIPNGIPFDYFQYLTK